MAVPSLFAQMQPSSGSIPIFPATAIGSTSVVQDILLKTTAAETIASITAAASQNGVYEYSIGTITGCTVDGATVNAAGTVCTVPVTFKPAYPGQRWVPLQVVTSTGNSNFGLQGIGTGPQVALTPGTITTAAGDGNQGSTNGGPAASTGLEGPSYLAVDSAGNVYISQTVGNEIRKVNAVTGIITAVAGNGTNVGSVSGFSGDGGPATSAQLSSGPVAIDAAGNLYIIDGQNYRIRKVNAATGIITTIAGNGTSGFSGDGGAATAAELNSPNGIAVDAAGNIYIADTTRIREITASTGFISTIAGNATYGFSGDGGLAASAEISGPGQLALDNQGNLYFADVNNNRIREINAATGIITTVAGNGSMNFSGDGGIAVQAGMQPSGIAVDSAGNLYIADNFNFRVRKVDAATGIIDTVAGYLYYQSAGDGGPATSAGLMSAWSVALDSFGNIYIADLEAERIRKVNVSQTALTYPTATNVGSPDTTDDPLMATVSNIGNANLTISTPVTGNNPSLASGFTFGNTSTCPQLSTASAPSTLDLGASCTLALDFVPTAAGSVTGPAIVTDNALNVTGATQTITLSGTGIQTIASTTTSLISSQNPSTVGQSIIFTATVAPTTGTSVPLGAVQFSLDGTPVGSPVTLNGSGVATYTTSSLTPVTHAVSAIYTPSSTDFTGSTSTTLSQVVNKIPLTAAITGNPSKSYDGTTSATLSSANYVLTGFAGTDGATISQTAGTYASANAGSETITATLTAAQFTATGSTNLANYTLPTSATGPGNITKSTPSLTPMTISPSNAAYGTSVTLTQSVPAGETGTVTFYNSSTLIGTATISNGVATLLTSVLPAGSDSLTAQVGGDMNYSLATSPAANDGVSKATPILSALTATPLNAVYGTSVTLTQPVPAGETGTVTFYNGTTVLGTGTISNGVATLTTSALTGGSDSLTAQAGGDGNYNAATSPAMVDTVGKLSPTLAAAIVSPMNAVYGTAVTLTQNTPAGETGLVTFYSGTTLVGTATISNGVAVLITSALPAGPDSITAQAAGDGNYAAATSPSVTDNVAKTASTLTAMAVSPINASYGTAVTLTQTVPSGETGAVTFYSGSTALGTVTISNGMAALTTSALPAGTDLLTGQASGDTNYSTATSPPVSDTVAKATSALTAMSVSPANAAYGTAVTLTQTVPAGETGTVTFYNGATPIGTATISNGIATLTTSALPAGTSSLSAQASGDTNYNSSTSPTVTNTVGKSTASLPAPSVSPANSPYGTSVVLTQTVPQGQTGTVTFYSGTTVLGTATVSHGVATLTTSAIPAGSDAITAQASGDSNYGPANSAPANDVVSKTTPTLTAMTLAPANAPYGTAVTLTQSVPLAETGTVMFYNGATSIGTATISKGVATLTTTALPSGSDSITAQVSGDSNYNPVTGAAVMDTVGAAPVQITLTSSSMTPTPNQPVTFTATLTSTGTAPSGNVQFYDGTTLLGTGALTGGVATLTSTLPAGSTNVITVQYPGSATSAASQGSNALSVVVAPLDFGYTLSTGSVASQTVKAGAAAAYNLTVTPLYGGFPGIVNFTVTGLPPGATYTLSPATLPANSTGSAQVLTVQTAAGTTVASASDASFGSKLAPVLLGMLVLPLAGSRRMRKSGNRAARYGLFCLLLVLGAGAMASLVGCGSGNGVYHEGQQSYTLAVTANSASISHSVTVTLNEQQ